jgi:hypothetical protein
MRFARTQVALEFNTVQAQVGSRSKPVCVANDALVSKPNALKVRPG